MHIIDRRNMKLRDPLGDIGAVDGRIILKWSWPLKPMSFSMDTAEFVLALLETEAEICCRPCDLPRLVGGEYNRSLMLTADIFRMCPTLHPSVIGLNCMQATDHNPV
jgi:hypothetical protein